MRVRINKSPNGRRISRKSLARPEVVGIDVAGHRIVYDLVARESTIRRCRYDPFDPHHHIIARSRYRGQCAVSAVGLLQLKLDAQIGRVSAGYEAAQHRFIDTKIRRNQIPSTLRGPRPPRWQIPVRPVFGRADPPIPHLAGVNGCVPVVPPISVAMAGSNPITFVFASLRRRRVHVVTLSRLR